MTSTLRRYQRIPLEDVDLERLAARLWPRVDKSGDCWLWTGAVTNYGYGQLRVARGPATGVHRLAYILQVGPIPEGLWILHRCDNRRCVRGEHLFLGTHADNMADMSAKGRGRNGRHVLTPDAVRDVRLRASRGETHESIARVYGVKRATISHVVTGRNWRAVA